MEVREPSAKYLAHTGYKQTEVGVIPADWNAVRLDSIADIDIDNLSATTPLNYAFNYISLEDVDEGVLRSYSNQVFGTAPSRARRRIQPNDLLVATVRPNLKSHLFFKEAVGEWVCSTGFSVVRCRNSASSSYIFALLFSHVVSTQIEVLITGSNYPAINGKDVKALRIPLPPTKAEQEAIAGALSDADALIESLEQLLAKKRQLKQGAMQELLTGKKRLPGFGGEWVVKRLGELAKIQRGASPRPIDSPIWFDENSSVGWVRISDVTSSGMYLHETTQRLSPLGIQNSRPVSRGSLIMSICATVGRPIITEIDVCIHDGFVVFDNLRANKHFLYYALKFIEGDWSRHGQTGSQMNLNTGLINRTEVPVPPTTEEQTAVATILSDMDAEIAALEEKLAKARAIKQGMMQELLTGRIRLVHPASNVVPITGEAKSVSAAAKPHNWQINEAVIIAVLAKHFGSEEWPLARKRCTKLTYLLHRYVEREVEGYLKKAAGPYNPATRYKGPEVIAQKNGYVRAHHNGKYEGYVAAENIAEAEAYFAKWYGLDVLAWLERFRLKKTDELELLATVDMAVGELCREGRRVELDAVKQLIHAHPEWQPKLEREIFSDANIARAIRACQELFG